MISLPPAFQSLSAQYALRNAATRQRAHGAHPPAAGATQLAGGARPRRAGLRRADLQRGVAVELEDAKVDVAAAQRAREHHEAAPDALVALAVRVGARRRGQHARAVRHQHLGGRGARAWLG